MLGVDKGRFGLVGSLEIPKTTTTTFGQCCTVLVEYEINGGKRPELVNGKISDKSALVLCDITLARIITVCSD